MAIRYTLLRYATGLFLIGALSACGQDGGHIGFPEICRGKCDSAGPLIASSTWVPRDGFVRAALSEEFRLRIDPDEGATIEGGGGARIVRFDREGFYNLVALSGGDVVGKITVRVSDNGPGFHINGPEPSSFVILRDSGTVRVHGSVRDPLGEPVALHWEGFEVPLGPDGGFDITIPAAFGINFVDLAATDAAGNQFNYSHAFLAAFEFSRSATRGMLRLDNQVLDRMAEKLSVLLPDLVAVESQDERVARKLGHDIFFYGATLPGQADNPGAMDLELESHDGSLRVSFLTAGDTIARGRVEGFLLGERDFTVSVNDLRVELALGFESTGDGVGALVREVTVHDSGIRFDVDGLPEWLTDFFIDTIREKTTEMIETRVGPLLDQALHGVQGEMDADFPVLDQLVSIGIEYRLADISPAAGGLTLTLSARTEGQGGEDATPGAPVRDRIEFEVPPDGKSVTVAVGYNLVNQFLYEAWRAGAMRFSLDENDLTEALNFVPGINMSGTIVSVFSRLELPPVIEPGDRGNPILSVGELHVDIYIDTGVFQLTLEANIGARAEIELSANDNAIGVTPRLTEIHVDIGRRAFAGLNPEVVEVIVREVAPGLVDAIGRRFEAFPLPRMDLSDAGLPGTVLGLQRATAVAGENAFVLAGDLKICVP